jgi:hypothetical protein
VSTSRFPFVAGILLAILLFGLYSIPRETLVPVGADAQRARWRLTGDEPTYLLTAQAIAAGDGEDVSRVHAAETYTNFWPRPVFGKGQWTWKYYRSLGCPYLIDRSASWGKRKQVIQRPALVSLFAAPFACRDNPRWRVLAAMEVFASLCAAILLFLAPASPQGKRWRAWTLLCFFSTPPLLFYACAIYPELLVGCLAALSLLLCRSDNPRVRALSMALLLVCPWGTGRIVLAAAIVSLLYLWKEISARNWAAIAVFVAGWTLYEGYNLWLWGYPVPPTPPNGGTLSFGQLKLGILQNFFGNNIGLFFLAPVAVVGVVCLLLLAWKHRGDPATWPALAFVAAAAGVVAAFSNPRAGTCPAGRYQVIQGFALIVPVLVFLADEPAGSPWLRRVKFLLVFLGALSLASGIWLAFHPGWWFERFNPLFKPKPVQHLYAWLPDFSGFWKRRFAAWSLVVLVLVFMPDIAAFAVRGVRRVTRMVFPRKQG